MVTGNPISKQDSDGHKLMDAFIGYSTAGGNTGEGDSNVEKMVAAPSGGGHAKPPKKKKAKQVSKNKITCKGKAYVMKGVNTEIGKPGAPGVTVTKGSAEVVPKQWTGASEMGPDLRKIGEDTSGTVTDSKGNTQNFNTLTGPIGEKSMGTAQEVQDTVMNRAPGELVLEIVGGKDFGVDATVSLTMPNTSYGCPAGTTQVQQ